MPNIPSSLLEVCREPNVTYTTNHSLVDAIAKYRTSLRACDANRAAIVTWEVETRKMLGKEL